MFFSLNSLKTAQLEKIIYENKLCVLFFFFKFQFLVPLLLFFFIVQEMQHANVAKHKKVH